MRENKATPLFVLLIVSSALAVSIEAGLIKDIFQKVTGNGNRTRDETVRESVPICGSNIFASSNEDAVSPELIFITNRASRAEHSNNYSNQRYREPQPKQRQQDVREIANEFRFNVENVTMQDLERNGFNPDAPVTFLIHGFTSGYPLQAWMSAIVEAYTIDRETSSSSGIGHHNDHQVGGSHSSGINQHHDMVGHNGDGHQSNHNYNYARDESSLQERRRSNYNEYASSNNRRVNHNLFIVNWNYGARGINYPRAVANIPAVANFVTRFINERLLGDARIDASRIQLIGHSLGAHLSGFVGKNTRSKLGRIYGLDPAGPCFGAISGPLYPASKRLAPSDAQEVITLHTNTALLGISKPLGKYSVFVEGGSVQPGCKGGGVLGSLNALTLDGESFDSLSCSHSRAPNLLTYRHGQSDTQDDCQLVAFQCKDWESYLAGHCGYCPGSRQQSYSSHAGPLRPVECLRVGLDWQYPKKGANSNSGSSGDRNPSHDSQSTRRPYGYQTTENFGYSRENGYDRSTEGYGGGSASTRRPYSDENSGRRTTPSYDNSRDKDQSSNYGGWSSTRQPTWNQGRNRTTTSSSYNDFFGSENQSSGGSTTRLPWSQSGYQSTTGYNDYSGQDPLNRDRESNGRSSSRRPLSPGSNLNQRERRQSGNESSVRRAENIDDSATTRMFLKTGDTQPYCAYQYQVVLELNEPFPKRKPPMSLVLQDSDSEHEHEPGHHSGDRGNKAQNSLTNDEFGNRFDDRTYTHLFTSAKKLKKVDHATLLFRESLPNGHRVLKVLHINYMSHMDPSVRQRFSSRLCPVKTENDREKDFSTDKRFYFKPCDGRHVGTDFSSSSPHYNNRPKLDEYQTSRRPAQWTSSNN